MRIALRPAQSGTCHPSTGPSTGAGSRSARCVLYRRYISLGLVIAWALVLESCSFFAGSATPEPRPMLPLATLPASLGQRDIAEFYPTELASVESGRRVYDKLCAECHGEEGAGDGPRSRQLGIHPTDFGDRNLRDEVPPSWYYRAITKGVVGTAMLGWESQLIEQQRWDVTFFTWSLASSAESIARGRELYAAACAVCHGSEGLGAGPATPLADPRYLAGRSGEELLDAITRGVTNVDHDWSSELTNVEQRSIIDYLWTFLYAP